MVRHTRGRVFYEGQGQVDQIANGHDGWMIGENSQWSV